MLDAIGDWATSHGSRLLMRPEDAARWDGDATVVSDAELAERADAVVSLGGDGTMLGALRLVARRPVPVLGVNLGNLGFLVEVQPEELPEALDRLERRDFTIEQHSALWLGADGDEAVAFNDLALVRVPGDGVVEAALAVGGQRMGRYRCDGLVISTSIGSTAYAYSAGGPVVSPALDAVVVAPLAPLAGISRPMVTAADEPIRLTLQEGSGCPAIEVDGTMLRRTEPGEALDVRLKLGCGQVVRLDSDRHQRRNQVKLSLLDLPFLPDELRELAPPGSLPRAAGRCDEPARRAREARAGRPSTPTSCSPPATAATPRCGSYLPYGPFTDAEEMRLWLAACAASRTRGSSRSSTRRPARRPAWPPTCASRPTTASSRSATSGSAPRCSARRPPPRRSTCSPARVRGAQGAPAGVEVRRRQRALAPRRRALRLHLRGRLPPAHARQGPQPRHRLVLAARRRVAGRSRGLRGVARRRQLRRRTAASAARSPSCADGHRRPPQPAGSIS